MTSVIARAMIAGRSVPPMAVGTWSWGDSRQWGYDQSKDLQGIEEAWHKSNELGITFYDTAEVYGKGESERILGRLISEATPEVREKLYIATKYLGVPGAGHFFLFRPAILTAIDLSLKRLGIESIDLYMIHGPLTLHSFEAMAKQLVTAYKSGKIKAVGVSNFSKDELIQMSDILARDNITIAVNQVEYSILRQLPDKSGLMAEMKKRGITCLGYSPLAMGRLTGKYSAANPPPSNRKFGGNLTWEQMDPLLTEMKALSKKYDVPMSAIAINWVICKGAIPLGGARNAQQAEQNAKAMTFKMTDEEVELLSSKGADGSTGWWQHG